jgi:hypothetical protein
MPAVVLNQVEDVWVRNSKAAEGASIFLQILGEKSRGIYLLGNDLHRSKVPYRLESGVNSDELKTLSNILPTQ